MRPGGEERMREGVVRSGNIHSFHVCIRSSGGLVSTDRRAEGDQLLIVCLYWKPANMSLHAYVHKYA